MAHHDAYLQPVLLHTVLSPDDTHRLLTEISNNRSLAHHILSHIKTIDPDSVSLRKDRQREIIDYCKAVGDYQTLSSNLAAGTHRSHHTGSCRPPSQLLPKHVELAQQDRAMLDFIMTELAHVSKEVRKDAWADLEKSMRTLKRLADHMTVQPPVLHQAAEFLSLLAPRHHNPAAFKLGRDRDLEALRTLKSRVDQCSQALAQLKPFCDAGFPEGDASGMATAYIHHLGNAMDAAKDVFVKGNRKEFRRHLNELEAIASESRHVAKVRVSLA